MTFFWSLFFRSAQPSQRLAYVGLDTHWVSLVCHYSSYNQFLTSKLDDVSDVSGLYTLPSSTFHTFHTGIRHDWSARLDLLRFAASGRWTREVMDPPYGIPAPEGWLKHVETQSGWWFGCHFFYFPIYLECHPPNWRSSFSEGFFQPPTSFKTMGCWPSTAAGMSQQNQHVFAKIITWPRSGSGASPKKWPLKTAAEYERWQLYGGFHEWGYTPK